MIVRTVLSAMVLGRCNLPIYHHPAKVIWERLGE